MEQSFGKNIYSKVAKCLWGGKLHGRSKSLVNRGAILDKILLLIKTVVRKSCPVNGMSDQFWCIQLYVVLAAALPNCKSFEVWSSHLFIVSVFPPTHLLSALGYASRDPSFSQPCRLITSRDPTVCLAALSRGYRVSCNVWLCCLLTCPLSRQQ